MSATAIPRTRDTAFARCLGVVPVVLAVVLLVAALLKSFELATEELSENSLLNSRWFLTILVLFELGLGVWLLGGLHSRETRWLLLLTFVVFFEASLYLAVSGYSSCRCLGRNPVSPWLTAGFDALAILAILQWRPAACGATIFTHPGRFAVVLCMYVLAAVPVLLSIVFYTPTGQMPRLRADRELATKVRIQLKDASAQQIIDQLHAGTGLAFIVDERLAQDWPATFGETKMNGVPAWAVMELLAHKQLQAVRWAKVEGGYRLEPSAPFGARTPWIVSGATLMLGGAYLVFVRLRTRAGPEGASR